MLAASFNPQISRAWELKVSPKTETVSEAFETCGSHDSTESDKRTIRFLGAIAPHDQRHRPPDRYYRHGREAPSHGFPRLTMIQPCEDEQ